MVSLDFFTFENDVELAALLPVTKTIPLPLWESAKGYAFGDEPSIMLSTGDQEFAVKVLAEIANVYAERMEYGFIHVSLLATRFGELIEHWPFVLKALISLQAYGYVIIVERKSEDGYQTRLSFAPTEKLAQYFWDNYLDGKLILK